MSDPDGTPLSVSAVSSNTTVVPAGGVVLSGSGANGAVTISTAGATSLGSSTITLTASDGSLTAVASFVITVMTSTVPGAPQNLVGTVSRNTVLFTWQAPSTAATEPVQTYVLDAGLAPGTTVISLPLGNVLSFATMAPDGVFYVRVRAVTPAGSGPVSNEVQVTIGQSGPPLPPLSLLATVQGTAGHARLDRESARPGDHELSDSGRHGGRARRRRGDSAVTRRPHPRRSTRRPAPTSSGSSP